jgi:hypothetical protein
MKVGLIDVDGHNFPNLALMKVSAWHKANGDDPYVMVYDKPNAPKEIKDLQRWVNNRFIFRKCLTFEDYKKG